MKERYTIAISGMELNLLSDESEEYVLGLAKLIDQKISKIVLGNRHCNKTEAALVCAMDALDDKIKLNLELENTKEELEEARRDNQRLLKTIEVLKKNGKNA